MKRGLGIRLLDNIISALAMGLPLPEKSKNHALSGNWNGYTQRPFRQMHSLPTDISRFRNSQEQVFACQRQNRRAGN